MRYPQDRLVFGKSLFMEACKTKSYSQVMFEIGLTPSQIITFWITEPSPSRLVKVRDALGVDPLTLLVPASRRTKKK
jgi:hypothetical protein